MLTGKLPYKRGFTNASSVHKYDYMPAGQINPDVPDWIDGALRNPVAFWRGLSALLAVAVCFQFYLLSG